MNDLTKTSKNTHQKWWISKAWRHSPAQWMIFTEKNEETPLTMMKGVLICK